MPRSDRPETQLPLDLPLPVRHGLDDYVAGAANRAALELVLAWPDWPSPAVLVIGPEGAGKSHLVAVWAERADAVVLPAAAIGAADPVALAARGAVAVEDLGPGLDETSLFHLLNAVTEGQASLLMTARDEPATWGLAVPDLASRLRAATPVRLDEPDDALLEALLAKLFADRQTAVDPQVLRYLSRRMERSYRAARDLVEALDRAALAAKSGVGQRLAARVLAERFSREPVFPGLDDEPDADAQSSHCGTRDDG